MNKVTLHAPNANHQFEQGDIYRDSDSGHLYILGNCANMGLLAINLQTGGFWEGTGNPVKGLTYVCSKAQINVTPINQ